MSPVSHAHQEERFDSFLCNHPKGKLSTNTSTQEAVANGWKVHGNPDAWICVAKATNQQTGEYHSTKILLLPEGRCVMAVDHFVNGNFSSSIIELAQVPIAFQALVYKT